MNQELNIRQIRDFGSVLGDTFTFLKVYFKPLFKSVLFIAGPLILLTGILQASFFRSFFSVLSMGSGSEDFFLSDAGSIAGLLGLLLTTLAGTLLVVGIVNSFFQLLLQGNDIFSAKKVWNITKTQLPRLMATLLLLGLLSTTVAVVFTFLMFLLIDIHLLLGFIGILLFMVFFLYIGIPLFMMFIIQAVEDLPFLPAFARANSLCSGFRLNTVGIFVVLYLVIFFVQQLFILPMQIVVLFSTVNTTSEEVQILLQEGLAVLTGVLSAIGLYLGTPVLLIAAALQYFNLVERKEAPGLAALVDTIGSKQPGDEDQYFDRA